MKPNPKSYFILFFLMTFSLLFISCNSDNPLVGATWKIQKIDTEFKVDGKFEKVDSLTSERILFNDITFENGKEFNYTSKEFASNKENIVIGGTGFYRILNDEIIVEYAMQRKSLKYKVDAQQLILIEEEVYEPNNPMIIKTDKGDETKVTAVRNTFYYKK